MVRTALLVLPLSVIEHWKKELNTWLPGVRTYTFHGAKGERERELDKAWKKGGVLLTTYGMVPTNEKLLSCTDEGGVRKWDYIILDEVFFFFFFFSLLMFTLSYLSSFTTRDIESKTLLLS